MSALRTLHLNTERTWRGGEQQTLYLAEGLARRGHVADVCCQPGTEMARRARDAGLDVFEVPMRGELDVRAARRIARVIRERGYDVMHMHTSHAHGIAILVGLFVRGPKRVVHRRVDFTIFRNRLKLSRFKYRHGADRYVAISHAIRDVLVGDGIPGDRISIVPSGIDPARLDRYDAPRGVVRGELGVEPSTPLVACVAHLAWHKGQEFLVGAVPRLRERVPGVKVAIVGEGKHRARIEEEIARCGVADDVLLTGFRADAPAVIRACDVLAMPSVMEGLNTTLLDAQCLGVPVVASRVGGIPEAVADGESGVLVPPEDPEALADALADLLLDSDRRQRLGARGRERILGGFTVDHMVDGNVMVYRDLLSGGAARADAREEPANGA